ncbi:MAG: hypothetical protein ABFD82_04545 [Syntrophaceae bacterium]
MKGHKHIILKKLYSKARASIFVLTILLMGIALIYSQNNQGGEIYAYTAKNGIMVISNTPIPEKHERRAQKIDSSNTMTLSDRRVQENGIKAQQKQNKNEREERGKLLLLYSIFR